MKIKKMEKGSAYNGKLPLGCQHCWNGSKMVLLVTGKCKGVCWYCPLSKKKKGKSVVYSNEKFIDSKEEILEEAELINATGTGITGGDPLFCNETYDYIEMLKAYFGSDHHIHLYTQITNMDKIRRAIEAGLDEIRFHPPVDLWETIEDTEYPIVIEELQKLDVDVGVEVPSIPEEKHGTYHLLRRLGPIVDFANLNELEFSSTNWKELVQRGYKKKSDISDAVEESQEFAMKHLKEDFDTSVHYCSSSFKDGVQMRKRIQRRAKNVAKPGEIISEDGLVIKGIILADHPRVYISELKYKFGIPDEMIWYDVEKERIEMALDILDEISDEIEYECYGVEEYPTADRLEVERWPLK
ncbi:MAG: radical SAM protein [Thermoplasmata archaeon]